MTGVYFPYWIYGGDFETDYMAHGRKVRVWQTGDVEYKETSIYDVRREGEVRVDGLSRNALNKADRDLIECVRSLSSGGDAAVFYNLSFRISGGKT